MIEMLNIETVRLKTMQHLLVLNTKKEFLTVALNHLREVDGTPLDSIFLLPLQNSFPNYIVGYATHDGGYSDMYLRFHGGHISFDERLELALAKYGEEKFSFSFFENDMLLNNISIEHLSQEIDLANRTLKHVGQLVTKYNNSAKRFNEVLNEMKGLVF